jgi:PAS domain-containing protein
MAEQMPLALILARNLLDMLHVPGFLVDAAGSVLSYNRAAAEFFGRRFEEGRTLTRHEWREIGPVDERGRPLAEATAPMRTAVKAGRPAHSRFFVNSDGGGVIAVDTTAIPLTSGYTPDGALVLFWKAPTTRTSTVCDEQLALIAR